MTQTLWHTRNSNVLFHLVFISIDAGGVSKRSCPRSFILFMLIILITTIIKPRQTLQEAFESLIVIFLLISYPNKRM